MNITSTITKRPLPACCTFRSGAKRSNPWHEPLRNLEVGECLELRGFTSKKEREKVATYANAFGRRLKRQFASRRVAPDALDIYRVA